MRASVKPHAGFCGPHLVDCCPGNVGSVIGISDALTGALVVVSVPFVGPKTKKPRMTGAWLDEVVRLGTPMCAIE